MPRTPRPSRPGWSRPGGGFTGAILTVDALRATTGPLDVATVEPGADLGHGIGYGTAGEVHRIDVPTGCRDVFEDDPGQPLWDVDRFRRPTSPATSKPWRAACSRWSIRAQGVEP